MILVALAATASAVPMELQHQGRLFDATGLPLVNAHDLTFRLYDAGGVEVWSETVSVDVDQGYYSTPLGTVTSLDDALFDETLSLGISIDGGTELPDRQDVHSVPFARRARDVIGGIVDVAEVRVGGTTVLGPGGSTTLSSLSCSADQVAVFDGGSWVCGDPAADWNDVSNVPLDLLDGDNDTLAALTCLDGEIPFWTVASGWGCKADLDTDTDTQLSDAEVDAFVTNAAIDLAVGSMVDGQVIKAGPIDWSEIQNRPAGLDDGDDDTVTTQLDWTAIQNRPAGLDDGDDDNDTTYGAGTGLNLTAGNDFEVDQATVEGWAVAAVAAADTYAVKGNGISAIWKLNFGRSGNNLSYTAPDGTAAVLDLSSVAEGATEVDATGKIAFTNSTNGSGVDSTFYFNIEGTSGACTLLHREDDTAAPGYYFATDSGNGYTGIWNAGTNIQTFILKREGQEGFIVSNNRSFSILCL